MKTMEKSMSGKFPLDIIRLSYIVYLSYINKAETKSRFADMPRSEIVAFIKAKAPKRVVDSMTDAALIKLAIELDI